MGEEHGSTEWTACAQLGHARPAAPDGERHPVSQPCLAASESCTATLYAVPTPNSKAIQCICINGAVSDMHRGLEVAVTVSVWQSTYLASWLGAAESQKMHGDMHVMTSCS